MAKIKTDQDREHRIIMRIVVDAYDEIERALGWYYYIEDNLHFPFLATCISRRAISPLQVNDEVEILSMPSEEECQHEIFVNIRWNKDALAVPLAQLMPFDVDDETMQAVKDWHYWVNKGYRF